MKDKKKHALTIIRTLKKNYPEVNTALAFSNPLQILVATILSAQCTDARVNMVTKALFKKYRTVNDYARARIATFQKEIRSTGFYRNKARNIIKTAQKIRDEYDGNVPRTMDVLLTLPGVARKTANIVLLHGYGIVEGIAVDTHVRRLSKRMGLSSNDDPVKIEKDLLTIFPQRYWPVVSNLLIYHGRAVCNARKPHCEVCRIQNICPSSTV